MRTPSLYTQPGSKFNKRWTDSTLVVILFFLLLIAITRLQITHWVEDLEVVGWLLFLGTALGYFMGRTRLNTLLSGLTFLFYSSFTVPALLLFNVTEKAPLADRINEFWLRLNSGITQLLANQPVTDSIMFILGMGLLFWILGSAAGFTLARTGKPWIPILTIGGSLILIEHYQVNARHDLYTFAYAVLCMILLGRLYYLHLSDSLRAEDIKVGDETSFDFMRGAIIAAVILGAAGWYLPSFAKSILQPSEFPTQFSQNWDRFTRNFENIVFTVQEASPIKDTDTGTTMNLGTGDLLGLNEVLSIETSQAPPLKNQYYWRLRSYDIYSDSLWSTGQVISETVKASSYIQPPPYKYLIPIKVKVTSRMYQVGSLYFPGIPTLLTRQVKMSYIPNADPGYSIVALFTSPQVSYGETYRTESLVSTASENDLLEAGTNYPQWVLDRYLQLPPDFSPRVRYLAAKITAADTTPYAKALDITEYLRSNITYQMTISSPPAGVDAMEWFLFDYKKGFCNYFATAEVLLLRSVGVPARFSIGYAEGIPSDTSLTRFSVREKDRHAWPEVYFPGYGWIPFEPTTAIASIDYTGAGGAVKPRGPDAVKDSSKSTSGQGISGADRAQSLLDNLDLGEGSPHVPLKLTLFGKILTGLAIAGAVGMAAYLGYLIYRHGANFLRKIFRAWRALIRAIARLPFLGDLFLALRLSRAERSFLTIERGLRLLGVHLPAGSTASETTAALITEIPSTEPDAEALLLNYESVVYGKSENLPVKTSLAAVRIDLAVLRAVLKRLFIPANRMKDRPE